MAAAAPICIQIENTYRGRHGDPLHPQEDRYLLATMPPVAKGIDAVTAFRSACTDLVSACAGDEAGSTFVAGLVSGGLLHVGHVGDSSLCLVTLNETGFAAVQLLTPWHSEKVYFDPADHFYGHIKVNRSLGDNSFRGNPPFNPNFAFADPIHLAPHADSFICAFSDGLVDFLEGFIDFLYTSNNKTPPTIPTVEQKLAYVLKVIKTKYPEKSLGELFVELASNIKRWEKTPNHDDLTCIALPIREGTLVAVADGHGAENAHLLAEKAVMLFPELLKTHLLEHRPGSPTPIATVLGAAGPFSGGTAAASTTSSQTVAIA